MAVENLGIANVRARLYPDAPHLATNVNKYSFDISAYNHDIIMNSAFIKPLLTEYVEDPNGSFAAMFPSKRKYYIDNYIDNTNTASGSGQIVWTPMDIPPPGLPQEIKTNGRFDTYTLVVPRNYSSLPTNPPYLGPMWQDVPISLQAYPNDLNSIAGFWERYGSGSGAGTTTTATPNERIPSVTEVHQHQARDGLWWAIKSDNFIDQDDTPFWVTIRRDESPSTSNHETCFIIRIGENDPTNRFDIYISLNQKPRIVDYLDSGGEAGGGGPPQIPMQQEWDVDLARLTGSAQKNKDIEIGIMTIAGRLVAIVNDIALVYTRIGRTSDDDGGKMMICKIPRGGISIFGTNAKVTIMACPMTFARLSVCALPLPTIVDGSGGSNEGQEQRYRGSNFRGEPEGSVAQLPTPPSYSQQLYGVDCETFTGDSGSVSPSGDGFHKKGTIVFQKASEETFSALPSTDFYTLAMMPSSDTIIAGLQVPFGGCPYFFRLKGIAEFQAGPGGGGEDISDYLISVDESAQAPDLHHIKKSASLTLYNQNNEVGDLVIERQTAIDITWGWQGGDTIGDSVKTFTGVVVSTSKSEIAGKETITLNCEDYAYVLSKVPIINSPFYDGMVARYAIRDLVKRAGVLSFNEVFDNENDYFLPAGYAFSKPSIRYGSNQMILECILEMVKKFEAYFYFDGDGIFNLRKLEGGLWAMEGTPAAVFSSDPSAGAGATIIEERNVEINFDSTVNCISILTVDRDTRNAIVLSTVAPDNKLVFLKPFLKNEPALGEIEAARWWMNELGRRMFNPILKTRFKTIGLSNIVLPLSFVTVDGRSFRVMSVKRSFNAETNDMNCSYECEIQGED